MQERHPHYLLYCEAASSPGDRPDDRSGWRFLLQSTQDSRRIEAEDVEPDVQGERLSLLALVRGLEALDQPSHVTLITSSRYVRLGLAYGLDEWRASDWQWERFGQMAPIKHRDLWQRVDQALKFHTVECRTWRIDGPHAAPRPVSARIADRGWRRQVRQMWQGVRDRCRQMVPAATV